MVVHEVVDPEGASLPKFKVVIMVLIITMESIGLLISSVKLTLPSIRKPKRYNLGCR
jgi:hypothetical protein